MSLKESFHRCYLSRWQGFDGLWAQHLGALHNRRSAENHTHAPPGYNAFQHHPFVSGTELYLFCFGIFWRRHQLGYAKDKILLSLAGEAMKARVRRGPEFPPIGCQTEPMARSTCFTSSKEPEKLEPLEVSNFVLGIGCNCNLAAHWPLELGKEHRKMESKADCRSS